MTCCLCTVCDHEDCLSLCIDFTKYGEVFHQIYKGSKSRQEMYQMIADTLTILTTGGEQNA